MPEHTFIDFGCQNLDNHVTPSVQSAKLCERVTPTTIGRMFGKCDDNLFNFLIHPWITDFV